MPDFVLPPATASARSATLSELKARIDRVVENRDKRWTSAMLTDALRRALLAVEPLGTPVTLKAEGSGDEWNVAARLISIQRIEMAKVVEGTAFTTTYPAGAARITQKPTGESMLRFPQSLAATTVRVDGLVQYPLPTADSGIIAFPWPDLLVSYAVAELYSQRLDHGATIDTNQFLQLSNEWKLRADMQKLELLGTLGLTTVAAQQQQPSSKRRTYPYATGNV